MTPRAPRTAATIFVLVGLLSLSACRSTAVRPPRGSVTHVVVCWLKQPGDEAARQRIVDASYGFRAIPGILHVAAGRALPSDRPVVDDGFDVAVVMTFEDEAALRAYDAHPLHQRAVADTLRPLVDRLIIYDLQND